MSDTIVFETWNNVPPGSTLHVAFEPAAGFLASGRHTVFSPNGHVLTGLLGNEHLPLELAINPGERHVVDLQLSFAGMPLEVLVSAHVEEEDGSVFQDEVTGKAALQKGVAPFPVQLFVNG